MATQTTLSNTRIAILATDGFEQVELTSPRDALQEAGATVDIVAPSSGSIKGWQHDHWGDEVSVTTPLDDADVSDYDGLVLPGGVMNPDTLRMNDDVVAFVRAFFDQEKPIAAICHGPWLLVEADLLRGRRATSYPSIQTDLKNAGAEWVNEEVVVDSGLITSRSPDDLDAFNTTAIRAFANPTASGSNDRQPIRATEASRSGGTSRPATA